MEETVALTQFLYLILQKSEGKSVISFPRIAVSDGGKYTCEARNNAVDSKGKTIVTTLVRNINIKCMSF